MDSAKVIISVTAGVVPEIAETEYTRNWAITSEEWEKAGDDVAVLLSQRNGQASGYAQMLMLQPDRLNWVRLDWLWL